MFYTLKEVFDDSPIYLMGIAYETYTYDEDKNMQVKRRGWEVPYREADLSEIDAYASRYFIAPHFRNEKQKFWECDEPFKDGMSGDETYFILHIKNLDGSDVSENDISYINEKLSDESNESYGLMQIPQPNILAF